MLNTSAPFPDSSVGRLVVGALNAVSDHPTATVILLATLLGAVGMLWLDPADGGQKDWMDEE